jgi:hypothetical protein
MTSWEAFRARGGVATMKRLTLLIGLTTLLANFATAQIGILPPIPFCVEGVVGSGLLTSSRPELPRRIEFETQVYHYESPWSPWYEQIRGYFWLRAWDESGTTVELRTRQIDELVVEFTQEGGVATFRGPAEATVQRGGFTRRYRGEVVVRALDGRPSPCLECPTDRLAVTFTSPELPSPITFDGYVIPRTGDIRVFRRCGR